MDNFTDIKHSAKGLRNYTIPILISAVPIKSTRNRITFPKNIVTNTHPHNVVLLQSH